MTDYRDCDIEFVDPDMPAESLEVSPSVLVFENAEVRAEERSGIVTVTNDSEYDIYFKDVEVSEPFTVDLMDLPVGLKPGASGKVKVLFFPREAGVFKGELIFELTRGYSCSVALQGEGIQEEKEEDSSEEGGDSSSVSKDLEHWQEVSVNGCSVFRPKGDSVNIHAAILPRGTGSLVGNIAGDSESRGKYTTDLQFNNMKSTTVAGGDFSVITGGKDNTALGQYSFIGTGINNTIGGQFSVNVSGSGNTTEGNNNFLGSNQRVTLTGEYNSVITGKDSVINGDNNVLGYTGNSNVVGSSNYIGYGSTVTINSNNSAVVHGISTSITDSTNVFSGIGSHKITESTNVGAITGTLTISSSNNSLLGAGSNLTITKSDNSSIASGTRNTISNSTDSAIVSGEENSITDSKYSFLGSCKNIALIKADSSAVLAGESLTLNNSTHSFIATGAANEVTNSDYSVIATGTDNVISIAPYSAVITGVSNTIEGTDGEYNVILGGNVNSIYDCSWSVLSGSQNQINLGERCSIIAGYNSNITECDGSSVVGGENQNISDNNSGIFVGSYNQILGDESVALGGHRNTLEGTGNVALGGNYGSDFGISHHVFQASKEGTAWQKAAIDSTSGTPTEEEPEKDRRAYWYNGNPLVQTGTVLMQAIEDPANGFYEGTSYYKKCFYTHADKYVEDGIWGNLPVGATLKTITVPNNCAFFWKLHIYLFNFTSHTGEEIICQNGIISNKDNQLSIVQVPTFTATVDSESSTKGVTVNTNNEDLSVTFELPVEYRDYTAAAKLTYTLLTAGGVDFYWE